MEEILASIRRIIADDEAKPPAAEKPAAVAPAPTPLKPDKPAAAAPAPSPAAPAPSPPVKPPLMNDPPPSKVAPPPAAAKLATPAPPPPAPPAPIASNSQDDIDALLSGLDEATTEQEIRPAPPQPAPVGDVFELTDEMAVPIVDPPQQAAFQKVEPEDDLEFTESAASRAMQRPAAYELSPRAFDGPTGPPPPPILSQTTITAVESAFNSLAHTVLSNNARTLEDLVKEMLRPMLKSWLDDNLPGLVERIVKSEIERVSRGR
jgi:cell pole-organizing protein PopZ